MSMPLQQAFVLHARPYRETSLLLELFTEHAGRVGAVARGARRSKSPRRALLQPFYPLLVNWTGRGDLVTIKSVEAHSHAWYIQPSVLPSAFYLNELLMRLLHRHDPHETLFHSYADTLQQLKKPHEAVVLRRFEKLLFQEVGYGVSFVHEADSEQAIRPDQHYRFQPGHGFVVARQTIDVQPDPSLRQNDYGMDHAHHNANTRRSPIFCGAHLIAMANDQYDSPAVLASAKQLSRWVLKTLLGDKPLKSRELFV